MSMTAKPPKKVAPKPDSELSADQFYSDFSDQNADLLQAMGQVD